MKKHLLLLRHAKSDWDDAGLPDIERPLSERGERDAPRIGKALRKQDPLPDVVLCSTARRARETADAVLPAAHIEREPQYVEAIYAASPDTLLEIVRSLPDAADTALMIGHNPGFEELAARLTGRIVPMPTAAVACIALSVRHWDEVADGSGELEWQLTPDRLDEQKKKK